MQNFSKDPITNLVECNGNWQILFRYNNYGDPFMFLLPNFDLSDEEREMNSGIIDLSEGDFNSICIIDNFIRTHPDTPFIVKGNTIIECINTMNDKLIKSDYTSNQIECVFFKEFEEFILFLKACRKIYLSEEDLVSRICYGNDDWRSLVNKYE